MTLEWTTRPAKFFIGTLVAGAVLTAGFSRLSAEEPKPAEKTEKAVEVKKQIQATDPHAGHNHGPVKPGVNPNEPPKPSVVLKEGEVPSIKFDTPIYDFGRVRAGTDIKHEFFFSNQGTGPLELLRVKPSCGCTVPGNYDKVIQKGETGKIPVTLSTKNVTGPMSKNITVDTNCAGAEASITLQIKGEVWQPVQVTPAAAAFGRITTKDAGDTLVRRLTIVNNLEEAIKLGEPKSNNPRIKADVVTLEEGKKFELVVSMVPPLEPGNNSGRITLATGAPESPSIEVQAYAFVTPAVDVTPTSMVLPADRSAPMSRQFYIRSNMGEAIKITDLGVSNANLKLELTDIKEGQTYRLKVDVPTDYVPAAGGDTITFKTDCKEVPEISIPISIQPVAIAGPRPVSSGSVIKSIQPAQPAAASSDNASKPADVKAEISGEVKGTKPTAE